ncbi:MAG: hypothetical protein H6748_11235 [Spirochaetaceae bacterium]|nr:hypothetical protein [Spirochaetaceae bacterium]HPG24772.1 hypothetical protein [Myxococcota bacterium]
MPPASPDSPVGRARGPVRAAARTAGSGALEALLVDLAPHLQRGTTLEARHRGADGDRLRLASGVPALDARLGGGFPTGRLCEIYGPPSSGRTALALSLLAGTLARGGLAAWIDPADAFDPTSAAEALGASAGSLERLLWVRARTEQEALRSSERLLRSEGFGLVVLDCVHLADPTRRASPRTGFRDADWLRLSRLAASARTTLLALSSTPRTGARAELVLELAPRGPRFLGPPDLLDALETTAVLRRHRSRPTDQAIPFSIASPIVPAIALPSDDAAHDAC